MKTKIKNKKQQNVQIRKKSHIQFMKIFLSVISILFFAQMTVQTAQAATSYVSMQNKNFSEKLEFILKSGDIDALIDYANSKHIAETFMFYKDVYKHHKKTKIGKLAESDHLNKKEKKAIYKKYIEKPESKYGINIEDSAISKQLLDHAKKNDYKRMNFNAAVNHVLSPRQIKDAVKAFYKIQLKNKK